MNKELIIEHYLSQLDRELQALPTGQRAEIITEIRSHILESVERDPSKSVQSILDGMGSPPVVAQKYLAQKGVTGWTPSPVRNWLRIFALSVAGLFALGICATVFTIWYFSPLIEVDEAKGRVRLLGGMIDVNEADESVKIGGLNFKGNINFQEDDFNLQVGGKNLAVAGEEDVAHIQTLKIPFNTAKLSIMALEGKLLRWECKANASGSPQVSVSANVMTLDLNSLQMAKCELFVPPSIKTEFKGINGSLDVEDPGADMAIAVTNGKVNIKPSQSKVYDFEVNVTNGMHDSFPRSTDKNAVKVKVDVINGVVKKE